MRRGILLTCHLADSQLGGSPPSLGHHGLSRYTTPPGDQGEMCCRQACGTDHNETYRTTKAKYMVCIECGCLVIILVGIIGGQKGAGLSGQGIPLTPIVLEFHEILKAVGRLPSGGCWWSIMSVSAHTAEHPRPRYTLSRSRSLSR